MGTFPLLPCSSGCIHSLSQHSHFLPLHRRNCPSSGKSDVSDMRKFLSKHVGEASSACFFLATSCQGKRASRAALSPPTAWTSLQSLWKLPSKGSLCRKHHASSSMGTGAGQLGRAHTPDTQTPRYSSVPTQGRSLP